MERDGAVAAVVNKVFSLFMFEGASRLPYFRFLDNEEKIEKISEREGKEIPKISLLRFQRFPSAKTELHIFNRSGMVHFSLSNASSTESHKSAKMQLTDVVALQVTHLILLLGGQHSDSGSINPNCIR